MNEWTDLFPNKKDEVQSIPGNPNTYEEHCITDTWNSVPGRSMNSWRPSKGPSFSGAS